MAKSTKNTKKPTPKKKHSSRAVQRNTKPFWRFLRVFLAVLAFLALIPVLLTLVYKIPSIQPVSTLMAARYISGQTVNRDWKAIDSISPLLVHSVVMSEDGQFCNHDGVDWAELNSVVEDALEGGSPRGASTLTMQLAKNLFLWNSRSYVRKILELPLAFWVDLVLSKKRIMEIYLNIAEWDDGVFGAESASQIYFKRSAKRLNRRQAALLTVTLPNPKQRHAGKPNKRMVRVSRIIEKRAKIAGSYVKCLK